MSLRERELGGAEVRDVEITDFRSSSSSQPVGIEGPGEEDRVTSWGESEAWRELKEVLNKKRLQAEIGDEYGPGFAAVNEDSNDVIAHASTQHALTKRLVEMEYDAESTIILDV